MSDGDYLPGEGMPRGPVPQEPPGIFRADIHTRWKAGGLMGWPEAIAAVAFFAAIAWMATR